MKHFLDIADFTSEEVQGLLTLATSLKAEQKKGESRPLLKGKVLAMVFQSPVCALESVLTWLCGTLAAMRSTFLPTKLG